MLARFASLGLLTTVLACGGAQTSAPHESGDSVQVVELVVTSGVPQPPPKETSIGVGTALTLRVEGLGPAHASVLAPDGSAVTTTDAPLTRDDGSVVGTEQRFTPQVAGTYRVVITDAPSVDLARVVAR